MRILWLFISAASSTSIQHLRSPYGGAGAQETSLVPSLGVDSNDKGEALLCSLDGLQVRLDRNTNVRTLTFGDGSIEARRLQQTEVHCKGAAPQSCGNPNNVSLKELATAPPAAGCDLDPQRCPCEFDMPELPPLDREYNFIVKHLLSGKVGGLNTDGMNDAAAGDFFGRLAGASGKLLLIGLGGGMLPQYLIHHTGLTVDAVELNGDVINVARAFFGLAASESSHCDTGHCDITVIQGDGLKVVKRSTPSTYGAAIVDCFGDARLPQNCRSRDFVDALYWAIRPGGEVLQNTVTGHPSDPELDKLIKKDLKDLIAAYKAVFGEDAAKLAMKPPPGGGGNNGVIVAKKQA